MLDENEVLSFDPIAFTMALIAAPLWVALLGCWLLLIPVAAVVFGGPIYLAIGTPVLLAMLTHYPPKFESYALAGMIANAILFTLAVLTAPTVPTLHFPHETPFFLLWGFAFAPLWSGTFALLYRRWHHST